MAKHQQFSFRHRYQFILSTAQKLFLLDVPAGNELKKTKGEVQNYRP